MIPNSKVPSDLEAAWMLACEPNDRTFCDDGMIPNSLKLFGFDCAAIWGSLEAKVHVERPNCGVVMPGRCLTLCNRVITFAK